MFDKNTTPQNSTPDAVTPSVPDQYRANFQTAAEKLGINTGFFLKIAAMNLQQDGQPPAMSDDLKLAIANENKLKTDKNSPDYNWQIYALCLAEQIADYRDTLKGLSNLDSDAPTAAADAANSAQLFSKTIGHNGIATLNHASTDTEYRPSGLLMKMIENFEGLKLVPYTLNGIKHIGIGHSQNAPDNPDLVNRSSITPDEARAQEYKDLITFGAVIVHKWPGFLKLPQSVQDACVSYSFNCGVGGLMKSNAMKLFEAGDLVAGAEAIAKGIHTAGGVNSVALEARRKTESWLAKIGVPGAQALAGTPTNTANLGTKTDPKTDGSNAGKLYTMPSTGGDTLAATTQLPGQHGLKQAAAPVTPP
jgi:GH24 family phage-related lysozyme (muramidase)